MKKSIVLVVLMIALMTTAVFAESPVAITVNGAAIEFTAETGAPFIDNGNTLVPFRVTIEKIGAEVEWNAETRTAIAKKGDITVEAPIGENHVLSNGEKIEISTAAVIQDGKTYLPIRVVVEALGGEVEWNGETRTVEITTISAEEAAKLAEEAAKLAEEAAKAKEEVLAAMEKSNAWKNYEAKAVVNMSMGELMNIDMKMDMTLIQNPMKMKAIVDATASAMGESEKIEMEMYAEIKDSKYTIYMKMPNAEGEAVWNKMTTDASEMEALMNEENKAEMEKLSVESIKSAKVLAADENTTKYEVTMTFEAYNEILGTVMEGMQTASPEQNEMMAKMFENMEDMTMVLVVDNATGEIVRYEMDLSGILASMFEGIEGMPAEAAELFKDIKMTMAMDILNVNKVKDFKIPEEALKAPELEIPEVEASEEKTEEVTEEAETVTEETEEEVTEDTEEEVDSTEAQ